MSRQLLDRHRGIVVLRALCRADHLERQANCASNFATGGLGGRRDAKGS